jgi:hypothetical protein
MKKSSELRDLILRLYDAMRDGDIDAWESLQSSQDGVLSIGTDPDEWWAGYDTITKVTRAQMVGLAGSKMEGDPQAYVEGTVGWYADNVTWTIPSGTVIRARITGVCHKEDGEWKFVQTHISIGVPNSEAFR